MGADVNVVVDIDVNVDVDAADDVIFGVVGVGDVDVDVDVDPLTKEAGSCDRTT